MFDDYSTHNECIEMDLDWVKEEIKNLTKHQRRLMLDKYAELVEQYGIGMKEYKAFTEAFDNLEE